jgi:dipeptidyl-peptidase-3
MNKFTLAIITVSFFIIQGCKSKKSVGDATPYEYKVERFADIQILRYQVPGLDNLTTKQKELVYYLSEAALYGRDIIYAQNCELNLGLRQTLEEIYLKYPGDRTSESWKQFETYLKRFWASSGIHHHYSEKKMLPEFTKEYMRSLLVDTKDAKWPMFEGQSIQHFTMKTLLTMFDPMYYGKGVVKDKGVDKVQASANNFYGRDLKEAEVEKFYKYINERTGENAPSFGLNSKLIRKDGVLQEDVYKVGGLYTESIEKMVYWLEKASTVAENEGQKKYIDLLVQYYKTGDLKIWDECNIEWVKAIAGDIDFIHGFIEVYGDPLGVKGTFESVIQINDFDASQKMKAMAENGQWFEDNSPIMKEHKRDTVKGISYKVVNVAMESGDAAPSTPIGINLPNANWIRSTHGSKSVSLGNILAAYNGASSGNVSDEFYLGDDVKARIKAHGQLAGKLHTAMHEVIGHASGTINKGIGNPHETLKNYASTLEEARADLVALYYVLDQKLIDIKVMETLETGKAEYDNYITNGLFLQLRRLSPGENIEEDHMRNRQVVAAWAYEKGKNDNVIEKKVVDGKTYFVINDYQKLRSLFGELLKEIQRIKSEGDYASAEALVEKYGVKVDPALHKEVIERFKSLDLAPYNGFIQPKLVPVIDNGKFKDLKVEQESDFATQMLRYSKDYGTIPFNKQ